MLEINQTNSQPLPESVPDMKSGSEEHRANQLFATTSLADASHQSVRPSVPSHPHPRTGHVDARAKAPFQRRQLLLRPSRRRGGFSGWLAARS